MNQRVGADQIAHIYGSGRADGRESIQSGALLLRLLRYLTPFRLQLMGTLVLVIITALVQAIGPALIARAIDVNITQKDLPGLTETMLLLLGVYLVGLVSQSSQGYLIGWVGQRFLAQLRVQIFDKIQSLPLAFFDQNKSGDLMSRLVNDIQTINQLLSQGITQVIGSVFSLVGIIIAMLILSLPLAVASFLVLPVMIWVTVLFARRSGVAFRKTRTVLGIVSSELEEELAGVRVAQAYNRTEANIQHFAEHNAANRDVNVQAVIVTSAFTPSIDMLSTLATVIVAAFGGWLVVSNKLQVGNVVAFFIYVQQFFRPIQIISNIYTQMQSAFAGAERIFDLIDTPLQQKDSPDAQVLPHIEGRVVFDHVNFSYAAKPDPTNLVLRDINLLAEQGQTIALVGETGAGKSTMVNLIPRFYDATSGKVLVDGFDTSDVTLASLRRQIGFVQQDTFLFSGTVADNIRYGRLDATDAEVEEAAKTVSVHDFILSLPEGYKTKLGERGTGLSQGQRQLIAFARTVLADARILILDEATSNIDTYTESLIQNALKNLLKGRTSFIIAHRLSTVRDADLVLVVDQGQIVERGTHDELLVLGGRYSELYQRQFP
ncbi:MAG: ABC transporter ATP-binding protein [Ktedonobacteraceae bacterium]